jgi:hypothetical protein
MSHVEQIADPQEDRHESNIHELIPDLPSLREAFAIRELGLVQAMGNTDIG